MAGGTGRRVPTAAAAGVVSRAPPPGGQTPPQGARRTGSVRETLSYRPAALPAGHFGRRILDPALLRQASAGPDRMRAGGWALRAGSSPAAGATGPSLRLAIAYLAAHAHRKPAAD
ncbi:hypothetical protein GCM10010423_69700 [Streptomyces levis]|uniref:Uncharacterized protein n=1 Tax=Streptomyces levis TaxID=285566 RepID=A0ABN3P3U4_9ACTN